MLEAAPVKEKHRQGVSGNAQRRPFYLLSAFSRTMRAGPVFSWEVVVV